MANLTVDHLRHDHQEARKMMVQLEALLSQLGGDPRWTPQRCSAFELIQAFISGPLVLLFRKKSEILFPSLGGLFPLHEGPLTLLMEEHRQLTAHFAEVCRAGRALGEESDPVENLRAITDSGRKGMELLYDNLYKEERVLFPMVARYLTPERDAELIAAMKALKVEGKNAGLHAQN